MCATNNEDLEIWISKHTCINTHAYTARHTDTCSDTHVQTYMHPYAQTHTELEITMVCHYLGGAQLIAHTIT